MIKCATSYGDSANINPADKKQTFTSLSANKKIKLMQTSRRTLLKQLGLGIAGLGIVQFKTFASPATSFLTFTPADDGPIRLSSNENPYGPSPAARIAMT